MTRKQDKAKYRDAAFKAWKTMRKSKREKAARYSQEIIRFIEPETIQKIRHPETSLSKTEELPWKGNRIVVPFHKTPPDIACGMFWELRWAYGCPLDCSYCYLRGTLRGRMKPQFVRTEQILKALDEAFAKIREPSIFNAGELSDALMKPEMMAPIARKFEEQKKHRIYLLTKFGASNVRFLLEKPLKQVICAWSINARSVAKLWERSAPTPDERIKAAKLVSEFGYDTRIRIDPIFPVKDWRMHYEDLIYSLLSSLEPNRIILGTPRGLWKTIKYARDACVDTSWIKFFGEDTSWGKKLTFEQRKEIYQFFFEKFKALGYPSSRISMCKETVEMWDAMKLNLIRGHCNCYGINAW